MAGIAIGNVEYSSRNRNKRTRQRLPYLRQLRQTSSLASRDSLAAIFLPLATEDPDSGVKTVITEGKR